MSASVHEQWEKELRVLLALVEHKPSADLAAERDRIAVLRSLIAERAKAAAPA